MPQNYLNSTPGALRYVSLFDLVCVCCRTVEEVGGLKRRLERYKSREWASCSDEVLLEEIKTYKVRRRGGGALVITSPHRPS